MFINEQEFKRMIKKAYRNIGLTIGNDNGELLLEGGYWILRMNIEKIPNKLKAAVIEITGRLPEEGEIVKYQKETDYEQTEIPFKEIWRFQVDGLRLNQTSISIIQKEHQARILQDGRTGTCYLVNECFIEETRTPVTLVMG